MFTLDDHEPACVILTLFDFYYCVTDKIISLHKKLFSVKCVHKNEEKK